jgi:hypothetical protein
MKSRVFRIAWAASILSAALMACNLVNQITQTKQNVQTAATSVQQGEDLLATAKVEMTRVGGSGAVKTGQALGTQLAESGLKETVQAMATQFEQSGALATGEAVITQQAPGMFETLQAAISSGMPGLVETGQAALTQGAPSLGAAPADIPVMEGAKDDYFSTANSVTYSVASDFDTVVNFYKTQMPANGWTLDNQGTLETAGQDTLKYDKSDRTAIVVITYDSNINRTTVNVAVQGKTL